MKNRIVISIVVIAVFFGLIVVGNANADDQITSMIRSEAGETQSSFVARNSFKSFSCEAGTTRVDGIDLNFTSTSSDDVYFAYCVKTNSQVAPVVTPIVPVVDTTTATATAIATPAVISTSSTETITATIQPEPVAITTLNTNAETQTTQTSSQTVASNSVIDINSWLIEIRQLINYLLTLLNALTNK